MYLNVNAVLETLFNTKLYCPWNRKWVALGSVITKITFQFQEQYYRKGHFLHSASYPYIVDLNREFALISKRLCTDRDCKRAWSLNERIEIWDYLEFALVDSLNWNMVIVIYQIKFIHSNENCTSDFLKNNENVFLLLHLLFKNLLKGKSD